MREPDTRAASEEAALRHERMMDRPSAQTRQDFARWKASDPAHAEDYAKVASAFRIAREHAETPSILALRHESVARIAVRRRFPMQAVAIAASLIAAFVAALTFYATPTSPLKRNDIVSAEAARPAKVYQTAVGERLTIALEDGSTAILNTASRLRTAYDGKQRRLILESGQALFEVAKGQQRPFVVVAGDRIIVAHGTEFDVRMARDGLNVALIEGSVSVAQSGVPRARPIRMRPSDLLSAHGSTTSVRKVDRIERLASWQDGIVIFENETLADAVEEMNRYVTRPVIILDPALAQLEISGAFRTSASDNFVEALQQLFPIAVADNNPGIIRLIPREKS